MKNYKLPEFQVIKTKEQNTVFFVASANPTSAGTTMPGSASNYVSGGSTNYWF